ncbi:E3 ubiquitin-protein ligase rnf146-like isoform X2 [Tigriopus californicus]|nr:E3 ubiquitin-protein ligase rnf146-like isoform X2 [Tigriopus californicus]|eukprot:TCALIF_00474-PA protein Name:"Similar to RNF146 E3 ubiquitin-protein ligase RNF146 (Macaca fascicularis)" AED:0.08 eAED:0.08 QI:0/-1/0/1/-1/1/1/0/208
MGGIMTRARKRAGNNRIQDDAKAAKLPQLLATDPSPDSSPIESKSSSLNRSSSLICSVCLDPPVHPVDLPCRHTFCYLCAKGLYESDTPICSLCRAPIPRGYLKQADQIRRSRSDFEGCVSGVNSWQWFYEGRNGWWKFEQRHNQEIEASFGNQDEQLEALICGHLYIVDFKNMVQYRKDHMGRRRKIKRDVVLARCKGVAGLVVRDS